MFRKVLIANRGEIAVRIMRACRELGMRSVAVYSDADRVARHVRYADEAYHIGAAPSVESYLNMNRIIEVAREANVDAIHPGYGFLAENSEFAALCEANDINFIGPSPEAIKKMGDKIIARDIAQKAGVPVVPGANVTLENEEMALEIAEKVGYPILLKSAGGGGGKGIRIVREPKALAKSLWTAQHEAHAAFGDDRIYIEKYIENPRHIEIQILADTHGNTIHLGERECSIQRRHQKLIEESPSPVVSPELRSRMGNAAVKIAEAVGYVNAGTVEFIVDDQLNFYFLEMNTRLQVEHPVTERVTLVDIVCQQFRIANGEALPFRQEDIQPRGWSIECRINAEDPHNQFLPSMGEILELNEPGGNGIRVDSGVVKGCVISEYYDPMIAKLIVWARTREAAIERMRYALREYRIDGIRTNVPFHEFVMADEDFRAGRIDTHYLERKKFEMKIDPAIQEVAAMVAALHVHQEQSRTIPLAKPCNDTSQNSWKMAGRLAKLKG